MQSLSYINFDELKFFAKLQGLCLLVAGMLVIVSHFFIYSNVGIAVQAAFMTLFVVSLAVYLISIFFEERLAPFFTTVSIGIYTILSVAMLFVFFM